MAVLPWRLWRPAAAFLFAAAIPGQPFAENPLPAAIAEAESAVKARAAACRRPVNEAKTEKGRIVLEYRKAAREIALLELHIRELDQPIYKEEQYRHLREKIDAELAKSREELRRRRAELETLRKKDLASGIDPREAVIQEGVDYVARCPGAP